MKKRILILMLALILASSATLGSIGSLVEASTPIMKDIQTHWGKKYIDNLIGKGGITGYPDGSFKPNNQITKAEFMTIALRSALDGKVSAKVDEHWASGIFKDAIDKGVILSSDFPKADWGKPINRYDMAYIMVNITENIFKEAQTGTIDVEKIMSDYGKVSQEIKYKYYVEQAFMKGLVTGKTADGQYDGAANGTRAEAATMVVRMLDKSIREKVDTNKVLPSTIVFADPGPIAKIVMDPPFTNSASGEGEGKITYISGNPEVATIDKTTGQVTIVAVGSTVITATKEATETHSAVTNTYTVNVTETKLLPSTIVFEEVGPISKKIGDPTFTNKVTSGEGDGDITYISETPGVATINKTTGGVTIVAEGTTIITATKAATKTHSAVANTYTINVSKKDAIKLTSMTNISGEAKVGEILTAGSVSPKEATVTYAWLRIAPKMQEWQYIPGATTNKYTIAASDVGFQIRVAATGTGNYSGTVASKGTTSVTTKVMVKENPRCEEISASPVNVGEKLIESVLIGSFRNDQNDRIEGVLNWDEPTRVLTKDETCSWTFIPADLNTYNVLKGELSVGIRMPSDFAGGTGTASDPYQVATASQLNNVRKYLDRNFIQTAYINLDLAPWNTGEGWEPIGTEGKPFTGRYNGNGKIISGLNINRPTVDDQALFGWTGDTAKLSNISLVDVKINGKENIGSLVGNNSGNIEGTYATGSVRGYSNIGGLVGKNIESGTIYNSYATCLVTGDRFTVGGLVGQHSGIIKSCYATGSITAYMTAGGLVGSNYAMINNSYATGSVTSKNHAGGLSGSNAGGGGIINSCYATGLVRITGYDNDKDYVAGIAAYNFGKVDKCYYDKDTTTRNDTGKGNPKTTAEMKKQDTFKDWDFIGIWKMNANSYPSLQWQK